MRNNIVTDMHPYSYMKKSKFLNCVREAYSDKSTAHLIALRDALSIIISGRINPNSIPLNQYEGFVKYE